MPTPETIYNLQLGVLSNLLSKKKIPEFRNLNGRIKSHIG